MARKRRSTPPTDTKVGLLTSFAELDPLLTEGEVRGRRWLHEHARSGSLPIVPTAAELSDLHRVMFEHVYDWAGNFRTDDVGAAGIVRVHHWEIREELHKLTGDASAWVSAIKGQENLASLAQVIADFHHRFEWIHPFVDTNGRTGRVLDHFFLWRTFGLVGATLAISPMLEYFPDERCEGEYYDGLTEADSNRPERLRTFYAERIAASAATFQVFVSASRRP